jgi:PAS domain S-box-containing protein
VSNLTDQPSPPDPAAAATALPATNFEPPLRQRAEAAIREQAARSPEDHAALSSKATQRTLHDLRVHQIELEMQNEELRRAKAELDAARTRYFDLYDLAPVGYLVVGEGGLILESNLTAATLLGVPRSALPQRPISRFILNEDVGIYYRFHQKLLTTSKPQTCELRLVSSDGKVFWAHLEIAVETESADTPSHRITITDITERKRAEEAAVKTQRWLHGISQLQQSLLVAAPLAERLRMVTDAVVRLFDADFCRVWLIRPGDLCARGCVHAEVPDGPHVCRQRDRCLHLLTSSGRYTHTDGQRHRRVPFGGLQDRARRLGRRAQVRH